MLGWKLSFDRFELDNFRLKRSVVIHELFKVCINTACHLHLQVIQQVVDLALHLLEVTADLLLLLLNSLTELAYVLNKSSQGRLSFVSLAGELRKQTFPAEKFMYVLSLLH